MRLDMTPRAPLVVRVGGHGRVAEMPLGGRRVPEFERDDIREVITRGYRVVYQVSDDEERLG